MSGDFLGDINLPGIDWESFEQSQFNRCFYSLSHQPFILPPPISLLPPLWCHIGYRQPQQQHTPPWPPQRPPAHAAEHGRWMGIAGSPEKSTISHQDYGAIWHPIMIMTKKNERFRWANSGFQSLLLSEIWHRSLPSSIPNKPTWTCSKCGNALV